MPDLYDIARQATDKVLGTGSYARVNAGHPDPGVQAAIHRFYEELECVYVAERLGPSCGVQLRWHSGLDHPFEADSNNALAWQCVCGDRFAEPIEEQTQVPQSEPLLLVVSPCCHSLHYWRVSP